MLTAEGPTAVQPGEAFAIALRFEAEHPVEIVTLEWTGLESVRPVRSSSPPGVPFRLEPGEVRKLEQEFQTAEGREDFGELHGALRFESPGTGGGQAGWAAWLTVFQRARAAGPALEDELRARLIAVVNARDTNGHIFLADFQSFFDDFLNIEVPAGVAAGVLEELGLPGQGLPADPEIYTAVVLGRKRFYGIEKLELRAEEDCVESDDCFDASGMRETPEDGIDGGEAANA